MQIITASKVRQMFDETLQNSFNPTEVEAMFWHYCQSKFQLNRLAFMMNPGKNLSVDRDQLLTDLSLLKDQKPIQYVTHLAYFMDLELYVDEAVLIPRPETEELVAWILEKVSVLAQPNIMDLCTGSGCIALALKQAKEHARVTGVDISKAALAIARKNARTYQLPVCFEETDVLKMAMDAETLDVIVSNPPYVLEEEKDAMRKNVIDYEPHLALFVPNNDPLRFYSAIAKNAIIGLRPQGWLFFEVNERYAEAVKGRLQEEGFHSVTIKKDIFDKPRMVAAQK